MDIALAEILHGQTIDSGRPDDKAAPFRHCLRSGVNRSRTHFDPQRLNSPRPRVLMITKNRPEVVGHSAQ
jgi:hypothetical protein